MAEVAVPGRLLQAILERIRRLGGLLLAGDEEPVGSALKFA